MGDALIGVSAGHHRFWRGEAVSTIRRFSSAGSVVDVSGHERGRVEEEGRAQARAAASQQRCGHSSEDTRRKTQDTTLPRDVQQ